MDQGLCSGLYDNQNSGVETPRTFQTLECTVRLDLSYNLLSVPAVNRTGHSAILDGIFCQIENNMTAVAESTLSSELFTLKSL